MTRKEKVYEFLNTAPNPLLFEELRVMLAVPAEDAGKLQDILDELEQEYKVVKTKRKRYGSASRLGIVTGRFIGNERGFGFVAPDEGGDDLFVGRDAMNTALHGDTVLARVTVRASKERRAEGEVLRVLERKNTYLVGTFEESDGFGFVVPDERRIPTDIFVRKADAAGAKQDDKVVVEVTDWREKGHSPEGRVTEILGNKNEIGTDILSIIRKHGVRDAFPDEVMAEALRTEQTVSEADMEGRLDLRGMDIVTIDGADAKDLDDAVCVQKLDDGNYRLGVHIADVSHYVRPGSALMTEAFERGTSVYLVDRVVPMLPRELSNGICSLNPRMDRLTLSVFMTIDPMGKVVAHDIQKSVIRTRERMTYADVTKILEERDPALMERYKDLVPMFDLMQELSQILRERRRLRGSIDFDFPEAKIILDENGVPVDVQKYEITVSNQIIEDFMLVCNETVAEHMYFNQIPFVYRVHETPSEEKATEFAEFLKNFGISLKNPAAVHPKEYQKLLERIRGTKEERIISTVMLRSLMKARYSDENLGHFGLAAKYYCHFTSPIRRFPDLVIHGIIKDVLDGRTYDEEKRQKFVARAAAQASDREIAAMEAERETDDLKKAEYMAGHVGEVYDGIISSVTSFGMFVELENTIEGLVRMADLSDDYYIYDEKQHILLGEHTKRIYKIGDSVRVVVAKADVLNKQIDFLLDDGEENNSRNMQRHAESRKPQRQPAAKPAARKEDMLTAHRRKKEKDNRSTVGTKRYLKKKRRKKK